MSTFDISFFTSGALGADARGDGDGDTPASGTGSGDGDTITDTSGWMITSGFTTGGRDAEVDAAVVGWTVVSTRGAVTDSVNGAGAAVGAENEPWGVATVGAAAAGVVFGVRSEV